MWCARADLERALDAVIENAILDGADGCSVTLRAADSSIEVLDDGIGLACRGSDDGRGRNRGRGRGGDDFDAPDDD